MSTESKDPSEPPGADAKTRSAPTSQALRTDRAFAPRIFIPAAATIIGLIVVSLILSNIESKTLVDEADPSLGYLSVADDVMNRINEWVTGTLGWYYILAIAFFIIASAAFGLSRFGKLKLAADEDAEPEFTRVSWFAMLFSAGMGIGLVFYGASEPLIHLREPPFLPADEANSVDAARDAMLITFMHWGIHAWAIYVALGLAIAFTVHRRGRPLSIRWVLEPLLGRKRVEGALGDLIDVTAVVATLFGVATSLGLGSAQINTGLVKLFGDSMPDALLAETGGGTVLQLVVIVVVTSIAVWSVLSGVSKGIKWLSNINMMLAAALLLFFVVAGPTLFIFRNFFSSIGYYFQQILTATFDAGAFPVEDSIYADGGAFQTAWTIFYWGWWISWAPFVAVFIARISKGRTIREFVVGVLLVPTILSFFWFAALGGTGIDQVANQGNESVVKFTDESQGLFLVLDTLPWTTLMTGVATLLVVTFFVTSSDSGSLVIDMLASGGNLDPPKSSRLFWALLEGATAIVLLLVGGLTALKIFAIVLALPFSVILIAATVATWKGLKQDYDDTLIKRAGGPPKVSAGAETVGAKS
ncbi:MAG: BCCT family transporter [Stackebrandtia sp.]